MGEEKFAVIDVKLENIQNDIKELYKRSDNTNEVINNLNISIAKLTGTIDMFSVKLDGSIEKLATKLDDNINKMNCDIERLACKNEKEDDREKNKFDSIWGWVVGGLIGIGFGIIGAYLGLK